MKRRFGYIVTLLLCFMFNAVTTMAQPSVGPPPGGGGSTGDDPPCWDPQCIPIDSGIVFLLLAGTLLAVRFIYMNRTKSRA